MKILIDTHIFLWLIYQPSKIKNSHLLILQDTKNDIHVSAISIAEIMIKKSIGKLEVEFDLNEAVDKLGLSLLDYDAFSALHLTSLPFHHKDPFDRMIISQAIENNFKIMTVDSKFSLYECTLIES